MKKQSNKLINCLIFTIVIIFVSCGQTKDKPVSIDFTDNTIDSISSSKNDDLSPINVAVSSMISPDETFKFYKELFNYIAIKVGRPINFKQKKTYKEVNDMLLSNKVDIAFICSGAYIEKSDEFNLLVAPVCNGLPYYQAYIISNKFSNIENFRDFKNKSFAFTDPMSNTGKLYALKRVKELNYTVNNFFSKTIYTYAHDNSIQMVSKNVVSGATIDGLIYEYFKKFNPERIKNIRIIEKSELYGIPPIVTSKGVDSELRNQLEGLFLNMHLDIEGNKILQNLLINKFTLVNDSIYDTIRTVHKFVDK